MLGWAPFLDDLCLCLWEGNFCSKLQEAATDAQAINDRLCFICFGAGIRRK
jgi:hypothetical protein